MQPQQGRERSDGRQLRTEVGPEDIGIRQRVAARIGDGDIHDHDRRHVVHNGGEHRGQQPGAENGCRLAVRRQPYYDVGKVGGEARVFQAVDDDVKPDGEPDDLPGSRFDRHEGFDRFVIIGNQEENDRAAEGEKRDRQVVAVADEVARHQQDEKRPTETEHRRMPDDGGRFGQGGDVDLQRNGLAEIEPQHGDRRSNAQQIRQKHSLRIFPEPEAEIARRHDIGQVGDDERAGGAVADKAPRHQKSEDGGGLHFEVLHLRQQDRRQDQRRPVVGEEGRHQRAQQQDIDEHPVPAAAAQFRHLQRRPFEKADLIKHQREQDDPDKGQRRVPDDPRHRQDVVDGDDAEQQRGHGADDCGRSDLQPSGLPDDEEEDPQKKQRGSDHDFLPHVK